MPFAFQLPTTSALTFSSSFSSDTHPSLPQVATTQRNILCNVLKKHKRLPPQSKASDLTTLQATLNDYIPYLFALDAGLSSKSVSGEDIDLSLRRDIEVQWRSTLSSTFPGRDPARMKGKGLDYEIDFALTCLAFTYTLLARSSLLTLYAPITPSVQDRAKVVQTATKHLLCSNSVHLYLSSRAVETDASSAVIETLTQTQAALAALAMAEATLLAVLKDDRYPFVIAQARNKNDKDWMIKAPEIPKVRAHLFARLCLAAAEHAGRAEAGLSASGRVNADLLEYIADLRKTARAKACRFFGIDAELAGETGKAIAWLKGGKKALGFKIDNEDKKAGTLTKIKGIRKDFMEKREDKKIEKGGEWGSDAGKFEELRVIEHLQTKWVKMNDTINTQLIPSFEPLIASMPSGRDIHSSQSFAKPELGEETLTKLRAPPERAVMEDDMQDQDSSDDDDASRGVSAVPGTFPGSSTQTTDPYY